MEIKKAHSALLEEKRPTFFLLGLILTLSIIYVALQYNSGDASYELTDDFEDLSQDLELQTSPEQKDMVSAEAASAPASKSITQEVKAVQKPVETEQKISATTSKLVIGDGEGAVNGADVKEAAPETPVDNQQTESQAEAPIHFTVVQQIPDFPGGWSAFTQWLTKNLKYPRQAKQRKIQGMVVVSFIVNKDGTVADLKVSTPCDPLLDREAMRVMKMMPKWKPGVDHDKPCRTMIAVPVVFKL